ncbi:MAG: hypothetical protein WCG02_03065 [Candidatus Taylorbacteria bacterium]
MKFQEFVRSRSFTRIIYTIGGLLVALLIFQAGIFVGFRIAAFSINWNDSHSGNIGGPRSIFAPFGRDMDDINPHGAIGEIIHVELPNIMVKGPSGNEAIILISSTTIIRNLRNEASTSDLNDGAQIVTIGTPDEQGQIHATFIRVVPNMHPTSTSTSASMRPYGSRGRSQFINK